MMLTGRLIGPVLGPDVKEGRGSLDTTGDGLAWELRKGFRRHSGLVEWDRVTKWEVGLQQTGSDAACVVFVTYGPDNGFLGLHLPADPTGADSVRKLTNDAAEYLREGVVVEPAE
jgi:hypothetical protein